MSGETIIWCIQPENSMLPVLSLPALQAIALSLQLSGLGILVLTLTLIAPRAFPRERKPVVQPPREEIISKAIEKTDSDIQSKIG